MHNLDVERMTVLADPRQEFRWLNLKTEEPNLNDIEDKADEVVEVNVVQELATNFSKSSLNSHSLAMSAMPNTRRKAS